MFATRFTERLGIAHPIALGGMGTGTNAALVSAVCNAGGLGVLGTSSLNADGIRREAALIRQQTDRPFGINFLLAFVDEERFHDELVPRWSMLRELVSNGRELRLLLWEEATTRLSSASNGSPESVTLLVGPEGSFTKEEVATAEGAGFVPVSLGEGILRTETAAVVGAALVLARYGRLG